MVSEFSTTQGTRSSSGGCWSSLFNILSFGGGAASGFMHAKGIDITPEYWNNVILYGPATLATVANTIVGVAAGSVVGGTAGALASKTGSISDKVAGATLGAGSCAVGAGACSAGCSIISYGIMTAIGYGAGYVTGRLF
jgi:hypothetical protein